MKILRVLLALLLTTITLLPCTLGQEQKISSYDRELTKSMLQLITADIKKNYYDPKFHGLNLDARFAEAGKRIDTATSLNMALSNIAAAVADLNDSHTYFIPPARPYVHDYGWRMQFLGDQGAFITAVRPGSDAEKKGVKPGDQILAINGIEPHREDFWKIEYVFWELRPQPSLKLRLKSPGGEVREVEPQAYFRSTKKQLDLTSDNDYLQVIRDSERDALLEKPRYHELGNNAIIVKLKNFEWDPDSTGEIVSKMKSRSTVILDTRGNPGGYIKSLNYLIGAFFDHEVKIGDRVGRKFNLKPEVAKPFGHALGCKLIVLIDSDSASSAELFARVMQLQKRGQVMGDRSSGSVMEARYYQGSIGADTVVPFGVSITNADIVMTDGKSLEHAGVIPDITMLPSADDLAAGRDPVLARATELAGSPISPEEAGRFFPVQWPAK